MALIDIFIHKVSSYANRGNVAVICWNTLNAATWYVDSEKLDGEVALGQDSKTLLAINFPDFTTDAGKFKETEDNVYKKSESYKIEITNKDSKEMKNEEKKKE